MLSVHRILGAIAKSEIEPDMTHKLDAHTRPESDGHGYGLSLEYCQSLISSVTEDIKLQGMAIFLCQVR